jgi:hypothetical protein
MKPAAIARKPRAAENPACSESGRATVAVESAAIRSSDPLWSLLKGQVSLANHARCGRLTLSRTLASAMVSTD